MKKFLTAVIFLLLLGLFPSAAFAAADANATPAEKLYGGDTSKITDVSLSDFINGFRGNEVLSSMRSEDLYAENYDVELVITDERTVKVTETIDVMFNKKMHGYQRRVPKAGYEESYRLTNVQATGAKALIEDEGSEIYIRLGDENETISGRHRYVISYDIEYFNDITANGDRIYQNVFPAKLDNYNLNATARIIFPENFELLDYRLYSGSYGSTDADDINCFVSGNTMYLYANKCLYKNTGATVELLFPDRSFKARPADIVVSGYNADLTVDKHGNYTYVQDMNVHVNEKATVTSFTVWQNMEMLHPETDYSVFGGKVTMEVDGKQVYKAKEIKNCTYDLYDYIGKDVKVHTVQTGTYALSDNTNHTPAAEFAIVGGVTNTYVSYTDMTISGHFPKVNGQSAVSSVGFDTPVDTNGLYSIGESQDGDGFTAVFGKGMPIGEKLTVNYRLISGAVKRGMTFIDVIACVFIGLILLAIAAFFITKKRSRLIPTIEFYPPDGTNPAEVGYIIDNSADSGDLTSLIYYWAAHGHLSIVMTSKKTFTLNRGTPLDSAHRDYEYDMYNKLWTLGTGDNVLSSELNEKYYVTLNKARGSLALRFKEEENRLMDETNEKHYRLVRYGSILALLAMGIIALVAKRLSPDMVPTGGMVVALNYLLPSYMTRRAFDLRYRKKGATVVLRIFAAIIAFIGTFFYASVFEGVSLSYPIAFFLALAAGAGVWLAPMMRGYAERNVDLVGRCIGFRQFLLTAEKSRLEMLLADNPEYFYDILPYAQVLGVSKIWADKFKGLQTSPPSWFRGDNVDPTTCSYMMMRSMSSMENTMRSAPSSSGSGGGGSFGGGFSGGGGGGGSGGGW